MSNKVKGYLAGIGLSLIGLALWVILGAVLEVIAGIAGALMGVLFIVGYKKVSKEEPTGILYIIGAILIVVEIIIAEFITVIILAGQYDLTLGTVLTNAGVKRAMIIDIAVGFALSFICYGAFIFSMINQKKRKEMLGTSQQQTLNNNKDNNNNTNI